MRSFRLLAIITVIGLFYGASPMIGRLATTANASAVPVTSRPEAVNGPANDNSDMSDECNSGDPRKEKRCHFDEANADNSNDNNGDTGGGNQPPVGGISVSNTNPGDGDTISFTVNAAGNQIDQVWWWVTGFQNDNDNDSSLNGETHTMGCGGNNTCSQTANLTTGDPGVFTIHARARDREGRESAEFLVDVNVHD